MTAKRMTMANKLDTRWDILKADPLCAVFQLYDADHTLDFYIGKDTDNQRLLLLVTPEEPPTIRDMRAISIRTFKRDDGKWSLLLTLVGKSLMPMFSMLCDDLIEASRNTGLPADKSLSFVLKRLSNWRRLLERGSPDLLSENEIRGICGELLFLLRLFEHLGKSDAVKAWVGPQKADQDFQSPDSAWEVKTIRPGAHAVTISSESQLQTTVRPIYLVVFELADSMADSGDAFTLNTLVDKVRTSLAEDHDTSELFEESLITAGYVSRSEYDAPSLVEWSLAIFSVNTCFPRITCEMLAPGISHVCYDLLLSACDSFRIAPDTFAKMEDQ